MQPRVLIVGTVPYNQKSTSRAFDAYFHYWAKENLRQVFSNTKKPCKGHCSSLFQITDQRMLKRWFNKKIETGIIYNYDDLDVEWKSNDIELDSKVAKMGYSIGSKHTPLTHLIRGIIWRKKFWCTKKLDKWLDSFKPDVVFLAFSDDYFINNIALYVAEKYGIPIVSCIGDDYYFNKHFSLNIFYQIYKESYKQLIRKVFKHNGSAIYISDKIRDKYNQEFSLDGETVYLTSNVIRKNFSVINKENPVITYFGNIRMGRNESLCAIANVLKKINEKYVLEVYSNELNSKYYKIFKKYSNINFCGSVPYEQVKKRMSESDITVIVEGFKNKDIELSRYSLSTKAADALSSGSAILVYGSKECGVIEYMAKTNAALVSDNKEELFNKLKVLLDSPSLQKKYYEQAKEVCETNHNLKRSCGVSAEVINKAILRGKYEKK